MVRTKICGITSISDAREAIEAWTDAIWLLVWKEHFGDCFIEIETAKKIVESVSAFVSTVLVTHISDPKKNIDMIKEIGVTTIQLHGDSTLTDILEIKKELPYIKIIKSIHITDEGSIWNVKEFVWYVDWILLDTINTETDQVWWTWLTHDWNLSKQVVENYDIPVILAGWLGPDNVKEAIEKVWPYWVDVNSGTKEWKCKKSNKKVIDFVKNAKNI